MKAKTKTRIAMVLFAISIVMGLAITFERVGVELIWMALWVSSLLLSVKIYKNNYTPGEEDIA